MIRKWKATYALFNLFNYNRLKHNTPLYKKLGLKKRYFSPISSEDFKDIDPSLLLKGIQKTFPELSEAENDKVAFFNDNGYVILDQFLPSDLVDQINKEVETLLANGTVKFRYGNKIMFAYQKSDILRKIGEDPAINRLLAHLVPGNPKLFQSINFLTGSQQKTHSDSIHMTTFPLGGLLGVWIALEDIDETNGALHYYPGSHKLPYYLNADYDNVGTTFKIGPKDYTHYERMMEQKIVENKLEKTIFKAKKGDLLIWHANLFHGGEPHLDASKTRKSMVFHYYDDHCICYHEITQRPALMDV